jgi:hypothetical protein
VTLRTTEMTTHSHSLQAFVGRGSNVNVPGPAVTLASSQGNFVYDSVVPNPFAPMAKGLLATNGGSRPHNNMMPQFANYSDAWPAMRSISIGWLVALVLANHAQPGPIRLAGLGRSAALALLARPLSAHVSVSCSLFDAGPG